MKVHVFTMQNLSGFVEDLGTEEEKLEFARTLPERLAHEDFHNSVITYEDGSNHMCGDMKTLLEVLRKPGLDGQ